MTSNSPPKHISTYNGRPTDCQIEAGHTTVTFLDEFSKLAATRKNDENVGR